MNTALWIAQGLMAAMFLMAGVMKLAKGDKLADDPRMAWAADHKDKIVLASIADIAGALGLVLPGIFGIAVVLTPIAAIGLTIVMVLAAFMVHQPRGEKQNVMQNLMLAAILIFIAIGRFANPVGG